MCNSIRNIGYLEINLIKEVQISYTKSNILLLKETPEDLSKSKEIPRLWIRTANFVKIEKK